MEPGERLGTAPGGGRSLDVANVCAHCDRTIVLVEYPTEPDNPYWVHPDDRRLTKSGKWPRRCWGYPSEEEAEPLYGGPWPVGETKND